MKTTQSKYFERFDRLFDDIHENIANGWRSFAVDDFHVAVIVLECMDDDNNIDGNGDSKASDNLSSAEKLREVKLWVTGYVV